MKIGKYHGLQIFILILNIIYYYIVQCSNVPILPTQCAVQQIVSEKYSEHCHYITTEC